VAGSCKALYPDTGHKFFLKGFAAKAAADDFLKRLPGDIHSRTYSKRVHLAGVEPSIKSGAGDMASGPAAQNPPSRCGRQQRRVRTDFSCSLGVPRSHCAIEYFCIKCHALTPQLDVTPLQHPCSIDWQVPGRKPNPAMSGRRRRPRMRTRAIWRHRRNCGTADFFRYQGRV
jgi:hypothetical protein